MVTGITDVILNSNVFSGTTEYRLTELEAGSVIYRVELAIDTAFVTDPDTQHNIEIVGNSGEVIFDNEWNDPNRVGVYTSSVNYTVVENDAIKIVHDLGSMTAGIAHLKIHTYKPNTEN